MASDDLDTLARLRGLLDVSRVVRDEESLPEVLNAVAGTIADSLGYKVVVVNLYRPAWDDFEVTTVRDYNQEAVEQLLGSRGGWNEWAPLLDERFKRGGVYFVPAGEYDWQNDMLSITPDIPISDDPNAWHPEDALFVPLTRNDGHLLGILSVDEPVSGLRPADEELEVLVALAEHVALALESAQEGARANRYRSALERLLLVSSRLTETLSIDAVLHSVAEGISDALGFAKVSIELPDPDTGVLTPRSAVGWSLGDLAENAPLTLDLVEPLLVSEYEIEGCYLLTREQARERLPQRYHSYASVFNGEGPACLVAPLAAGAAVRPRRRPDGRDLGGRPDRPAAAVARAAAGAARVCEPGDGGAGLGHALRGGAVPGRARPARRGCSTGAPSPAGWRSRPPGRAATTARSLW